MILEECERKPPTSNHNNPRWTEEEAYDTPTWS